MEEGMEAVARFRNLSQVLLSSEILQIALGFGLLCACTQISIPMQPVPITLQSAAVLFLGLCYNKKTALKTIVLYISAGALGLPIFTNYGFGLAKLFGPTGGYLLGFLLAIYVMTTLAALPKMSGLPGMIMNSALGSLAIFLPGILWLAQFVGFSQAFWLGFVPFIIPGAIKALLLAFAVRAFRKPY
jgi:biotin transport system substrate-specific component